MSSAKPRSAEPETHFGFTNVPLSEKQGLVDDVFHKVASRYDLMNDLMSGGLHRIWKDVLVAQVKPSKRGPFRHLAVAGGTGDVAFRIVEAGGPQTDVTILDINGDMLGVGRARAEKRRLADRLEFVQANAEELPFEDGLFDAYTIAFGKGGGHFLCLEFSEVDVPGLDRFYNAFSFNLIPPIGRLVTGDAEPYRYLVESIRKFPKAERFRAMIAEAGFQRANFTRLTGGVVCIHSGWKL